MYAIRSYYAATRVTMDIEEILIIKDGNIGYGIETSWIDQILRVPDLTPVVLSSPLIRGLSAVSGNIVTVYDLQMLLGLHKVSSEDESSRLLTLNESCNALLVSEVSDTVMIDNRQIEYVDVITSYSIHYTKLYDLLPCRCPWPKSVRAEYSLHRWRHP